MLLPALSQCWGYRLVPPCQALAQARDHIVSVVPEGTHGRLRSSALMRYSYYPGEAFEVQAVGDLLKDSCFII